LIGRTVALKTISIDRNAPNRKELIERLKQEAKAAGGLDHPNIITIYDVGQEDDRVYLSMQFLEGKTLQALLTEGDLPPLPTLISYAEQICSAVGFAHARNVIHRDLKPANLMLTSQGVIKVLDFGIAKLEDATLTQTGLVVGTPTHMAPEQASDRKIDHRIDIFALGSVFYELFTREKPFRGDVATILYKIMHEDPVAPSIINPGLPSGIDAIIRKALAKKPKDRFQTCEEMGEAFREQAALLKKIGANASVTKAANAPAIQTAAAAPRPEPSSASYLLETTTVRPRKSKVLPLTLVLLLAIGGAAGWASYVKSRTGSFPPAIQALIAAAQRAFPGRPANGPSDGASSSQQGATPASSSSDSNVQQPGGNTGSSATANPASGTQAQTTNPETQPLSGASASSSVPSNESRGQGAGNGPASTTSPEASEPAQTTGANTGASTGSQTPNQSQSPATSNASQPGTQSTVPSAGPKTAAPQKQDEAAGEQRPSTTPAKTPAKESVARVDGFTRRDVPELLRQADAAAGRSDYRLARYEYTLILKLDHNNAAARAGLRSVQSAEERKAH
jgi:eukaryotic-like serine/threonine-protein kinase